MSNKNTMTEERKKTLLNLLAILVTDFTVDDFASLIGISKQGLSSRANTERRKRGYSRKESAKSIKA